MTKMMILTTKITITINIVIIIEMMRDEVGLDNNNNASACPTVTKS